MRHILWDLFLAAIILLFVLHKVWAWVSRMITFRDLHDLLINVLGGAPWYLIGRYRDFRVNVPNVFQSRRQAMHLGAESKGHATLSAEVIRGGIPSAEAFGTGGKVTHTIEQRSIIPSRVAFGKGSVIQA